MNSTKELLVARKTELLSYRHETEKRLNRLKYKGEPQYRVRIASGKNQVYVKASGSNSREKYISKDNIGKAEQIATYDYLKETLKRINLELNQIDRVLKAFVKSSPEEYYNTLTPARQNLIKSFDENDETDFRTVKDERVRSKSEILIANALERKGVPYKYECPIIFNELGVIHPDFTALNVKKRKVIYWEHLGKMDDPDYARKNAFRINVYQKHGLFLGDSLIITMETSTLPLDVKLVDELINHYLLE